ISTRQPAASVTRIRPLELRRLMAPSLLEVRRGEWRWFPPFCRQRDVVRQTEIARRPADGDLVTTRNDGEAAGAGIPVRERALVECERDFAFGAGIELEATERLQLSSRSAVVVRPDVELHDFLAAAFAGVADSHCHVDVAAVGLDGQILVAEVRVAESVAEAVRGLELVAVEVPVAD